MGSLRMSVLPEISERKRFDLWLRFNPSAADCTGYKFFACYLGTGSSVCRRRITNGDMLRCCRLFAGGGEEKRLHGDLFTYGVGCSISDSSKPNERLKWMVVRGSEGIGGSPSVTELVEESRSSEADEMALANACPTLKNPAPNLMTDQKTGHKGDLASKSKRKLWKQSPDMKNAANRKVLKPTLSRNCKSLVYTRNDAKLNNALSTIGPESDIEHCNTLLKLLEKSSDEKTVKLFDWMKSNDKLKQNATAYTLALRAMARKEDWDSAKTLIQEMTSASDCQLNSQVFNAVIYVCAKRGLVEWGAKWFDIMLQSGVQPDVATIGMLMGLYQKRANLKEAEITFGHMRSFKLHCVTGYSSMITIYTRMSSFDKAEEIIRLMEEDEVLPNLENWLVRLNAFSQQGKLEEAESVLKSMLDAGISPNIVAYNTLITGYGKVSNIEAAKCIFQKLPRIGLEPDETTYRSMVEGLGRTDNYKEAMCYYEELKNSGYQPSSSNFYTMINLQARHGDDKGILQTLRDMRAAGCLYSSILGILLQAYERVGRVSRVPDILQASFYESILVNQTSCSILVVAYVQNSLLDDALQVLKDKRWKDINFEESLYHLLICSCKEADRHEDAVKVYSQMPQSGLKPNLHIACSMIDIYSALNRFSDAESLYLKLKATGINFDMVGYSIIVRMYIKARFLKDACMVLDIMEKQKDIVPDKFLFRDMLRVYQQCGMVDKLANAYYWILKSGIPWDEAMYNCVINCCGHALPVDELSRLFNEMIQQGYTANTITLNVMLDVYGKAGFLKKATKLFWMARKQGLTDIITYNTIIAACGQSKDFRRMRYFVRRMQYAGYPVSLEAYNSMLDAYGKEDQLEEFNDLLLKMKEARCGSDHYTYNILINIYGKKGWIKEVSSVLAELKEHGLEPDLYSYNTLIKAYGIAGMVEEAVNMVQEMRLKGVKPDRVTYANLIAALQRNENFLEAVKWSLWMKQMEMSG